MSGEHRSAADKHRRNIQTCSSHKQTGHVFITVGNHNKSIKTVSHSHSFGRICDKIAGNKRIFHSLMSHSNTVAYCDRREYNRCAACHSDTDTDSLNDLVNVGMSGYDLVV